MAGGDVPEQSCQVARGGQENLSKEQGHVSPLQCGNRRQTKDRQRSVTEGAKNHLKAR